jgi:hypothetical protein
MIDQFQHIYLIFYGVLYIIQWFDIPTIDSFELSIHIRFFDLNVRLCSPELLNSVKSDSNDI